MKDKLILVVFLKEHINADMSVKNGASLPFGSLTHYVVPHNCFWENNFGCSGAHDIYKTKNHGILANPKKGSVNAKMSVKE